jgi:MOSC domain-containing protein YiiM
MAHKTAVQLQAGMPEVLAAPKDVGTVRLIVRRPGVDEREVLETARLEQTRGLVGDHWEHRAGRSGEPDVYAQLTVMNARYAELIAGSTEPDRWALAGDQLYLDLDISEANLPSGTRLSVGTAMIAISAEAHTGCAKFSARFGSEALKLANTSAGRALRLRGANAAVVESGVVRTGDIVRRI